MLWINKIVLIWIQNMTGGWPRGCWSTEMPKFREEAQKAETGIKIIPRCEIIANAGQYAIDKEKGLSLIYNALMANAGGIIFSLWGDPALVLPDDWLIEFKKLADGSGIDFIGEPWKKEDIKQFERINVKR